MKTRFIFTLVAILVATFPVLSQVSMRTEQDITKLSDKLTLATLEGDISELNKLYDADAIQLPNYGSMIKGRKAILDKEIENRNKGYVINSFTTKPEKFYGSSRSVVEVGFFEMSTTAPNTRQLFKDSGSYMTIWVKKGRDWFVEAEMWNTDEDPMQRYKTILEKGGQTGTAGETPNTQKGESGVTTGTVGTKPNSGTVIHEEGKTFDPEKAKGEPKKETKENTNPNSEGKKNNTVTIKKIDN